MRQNKICCKWQSKEIWRMTTYIRPWVIVKSLGQRLILPLRSSAQKLDLFKQAACSKLSEMRSISFACVWLLWAPLTRSRVVPHFIIRTFTNKNCLKNPSTENRHRRIFPLHFFFIQAFLSSFRIYRIPTKKKIQKFETFFSWLLLSCPATTLTNYVFGSLFVLFSYFTFCFCFLSTILGQL